ncbi:MAG TPA: hypothetical protein VFU14_07675 [Acidimicrobiales bacterium]|nr:hypothetical protein [Acidimicrobiales bacterium]
MADERGTGEHGSNPLSGMLGRLSALPAEQLRLMRDLLDTFSPSMDQLGAIRRELEAQRAQVEAMLAQLEHMEATLERLVATAEQLRAMQEPFQRLTHLFNPDRDRDR